MLARLLLSVSVLVASAAWRQADPGGPAGEPDAANSIAATVNGVPLFVAQVERQVQLSVGDRKVTDEARRQLQAEALEQLVKQQLVLAHLERQGEAASLQDVEFSVGQLTNQLARQERTLDEYLRARGLNEQSLRQALRWQLSWKDYLAKQLTEDKVQRHFEKHRAQFDGTRLRVAQILLKIPASADGRETTLRSAAKIRDEIVSGRLSFADAARRHSDSPSASAGGELGWIARREPMPESFSAAAFQLEQGAVSEPLVSPFGVHLIQCLEIQPGRATWEDVREDVEAAMTSHLFDWASSRPDQEAEIRYTGAVPHFRPGTREVAQ